MEIKQFVGAKVLITTQNWFMGPDGRNYKAIWGTLQGIYESKDLFGFTPSRQHTNWMLQVGNMVVMGCQALYCIHCPNRPDMVTVKHHTYSESSTQCNEFDKPSEIYLAE